MNTEHWQKIDALFDEYLDSSPEVQATFFAEKNLDADTQNELQKLISAIEKSETFIESSNFTPVKEILDQDEPDNLIGTQIYTYHIEKLLGKGGMGTVYLAKRTGDFNKEVAIKIIPPFSNSSGKKELFRRERQILAKLEHPNIARILDGGTTENGLPFLVMEYVEGIPLNEFCQDLTINERLKLFQDVCQAVDYAHKNLVVHRDLKPTNIFVKNNKTVKLLDFGIAKLLEKEEFGGSNKTTFTGNALTPEYASPEQINGENITIASDIYSLGVILYEILTGGRPHNFKGKSLNQILQIVTNSEPKAPDVSNELDAITLKSLSPNPSNRYQTAEEFSQDISNYLNNLPISARPNTFFYQLEKTIMRHKLTTAITALILLILIGWMSTVVWQTSSAKTLAAENRKSAYAAEMILAANEYENTNLNRVNELVQKYQPEDNEEDLRGFEWFFLKNLLNPTSKITSFLHKDEVWNLEFSPNGKLLTTVSNDNIVRVWDVEKAEVISQTTDQKGAWKCSYFPDNTRFAVSMSSAGNPVVKVFETETAKEVLTLNGHTKRVRAVAVAPDGKTIASGSQDGTVRIWDAETGKELNKFEFSTIEKGIEINDVQFSKSGEKLVVIGFETLAVFNTKTWQKTVIDITQFADRNITLFGWKVVFSPLEKTIALGNFQGEVVFLDADKLKIIRALKLHQANVKSLAFSNDGKILATGSWDRTVKFIDVQTGEIINELRGHFAGIHEVVFTSDGKKFATASADFNVNLWNPEQVLKSNSIPTNAAISIFTNKNKNIITWASASGEFTNWDLQNKKKNWSVNSKINVYSADASNITNQLIFGERDGFISIYNLLEGKELRRFNVYDKTIYAIKFSADGKQIFATYEDGTIKAINAETAAEVFSIKSSNEIIKGLAVSPNGKYFASGGNDKTVRVFESETGKELFKFDSHTKPLYSVVFSADSSLMVSIGADDIARIWRVSDGQLLHELTGMSAGIFAVAFSPDSKRLATASDVGIIRLWDVESGKQVLAFTASQRVVNQLKFSEDGKTLISIDNSGKISFWEGGFPDKK